MIRMTGTLQNITFLAYLNLRCCPFHSLESENKKLYNLVTIPKQIYSWGQLLPGPCQLFLASDQYFKILVLPLSFLLGYQTGFLEG